MELRRNYGPTAVLQVGFEQARGSIVVSLDGDLQLFPKEIPSLLAKLDDGYDVVGADGEPIARRASSADGLHGWPTGSSGVSRACPFTTLAQRSVPTGRTW